MEANEGTELRFLVDICCCSDIRHVCYHVRITHYRELFGQLHFLFQQMQFGIFKGKKAHVLPGLLVWKGTCCWLRSRSRVLVHVRALCVGVHAGRPRPLPHPGARAGSRRCSRRSVTMAAITCASLGFQSQECQPSLW